MSHSTDFYNLKAELGYYLNLIDDEILELQKKRNILFTAIQLAQTCGEHCDSNNIGE